MNDQKNLLLVTPKEPLSLEEMECLAKALGSLAGKADCNFVFVPHGMDATVVPTGLPRLCAAIEAQGDAINGLLAYMIQADHAADDEGELGTSLEG